MDIGGSRIDRLIASALSGLTVRQRVVADNVANVDTPGFKASEVQFEDLLRQARDDQDGLALLPVRNGVQAAPDASGVEPRIVTLAGLGRRGDGNNVDVDQQMEQLAETNLTYNGLAQLVASRMQLLRTVVNDGRR